MLLSQQHTTLLGDKCLANVSANNLLIVATWQSNDDSTTIEMSVITVTDVVRLNPHNIHINPCVKTHSVTNPLRQTPSGNTVSKVNLFAMIARTTRGLIYFRCRVTNPVHRLSSPHLYVYA